MKNRKVTCLCFTAVLQRNILSNLNEEKAQRERFRTFKNTKSTTRFTQVPIHKASARPRYTYSGFPWPCIATNTGTWLPSRLHRSLFWCCWSWNRSNEARNEQRRSRNNLCPCTARWTSNGDTPYPLLEQQKKLEKIKNYNTAASCVQRKRRWRYRNNYKSSVWKLPIWQVNNFFIVRAGE